MTADPGVPEPGSDQRRRTGSAPCPCRAGTSGLAANTLTVAACAQDCGPLEEKTLRQPGSRRPALEEITDRRLPDPGWQAAGSSGPSTRSRENSRLPPWPSISCTHRRMRQSTPSSRGLRPRDRHPTCRMRLSSSAPASERGRGGRNPRTARGVSGHASPGHEPRLARDASNVRQRTPDDRRPDAGRYAAVRRSAPQWQAGRQAVYPYSAAAASALM